MSVRLDSLLPGDKFTLEGHGRDVYTYLGPKGGLIGAYACFHEEANMPATFLGSRKVDPVLQDGDQHAAVMAEVRRTTEAMRQSAAALNHFLDYLQDTRRPRRDEAGRLTVERVNELLGVNLWETTRGFRTTIAIDFDEYGRVMKVENLDKKEQA